LEGCLNELNKTILQAPATAAPPSGTRHDSAPLWTEMESRLEAINKSFMCHA
jgi:hypothetical protein